jgi:hypothetical protein
MNIKFQMIVALFLIVFAVGCGPNNKVTGKVTFPDGSPLTEGEVIFESPTLMAKGSIKKDGTYVMETGELKGVPQGTYQVSLGGFKFEEITFSGVQGAPPTITPLEIPVDRKFLSSTRSGLTCEVKGRTTYNITVEAPAK